MQSWVRSFPVADFVLQRRQLSLRQSLPLQGSADVRICQECGFFPLQEHQRIHTYLLLTGTRTVEDRDGSEDEEAVSVKKLSEKLSKEIEHQVYLQPGYESQERSELKI